MGDRSSIEWTDATWNPTVGCTSVSPGCDNCYARQQVNTRFHPAAVALANKEGRNAHPDDEAAAAGVARGHLTMSAFPTPFGVVSLRPGTDLLTKPLKWNRPRRIFVNSLSDLFHKDVPDEFVARVFAVMALAPQHQFQLLTKRHGRMRSLLTSDSWEGLVLEAIGDLWADGVLPSARRGHFVEADERVQAGPLPNVWVGVSVETQREADLRIPALLDTPATVRFLSCEPLLGPVDLAQWLGCPCGECQDPNYRPALHWVIVGGESGRNARPMHPEWAREIREDCRRAGVPFLFKQWGEWAPREITVTEVAHREGDTLVMQHREHQATVLKRVGKKAAGRTLDGIVHDGYPS